MDIGDRVTWLQQSTRRGTTTLRHREGVIVEINGKLALVRRSSGKSEWTALDNLRPDGQKSKLSDIVEAMFGRC